MIIDRIGNLWFWRASETQYIQKDQPEAVIQAVKISIPTVARTAETMQKDNHWPIWWPLDLVRACDHVRSPMCVIRGTTLCHLLR